jgi:type IV pilus assembly protein PilA
MKRKKLNKYQQGFSLIEMILVMGIFAVLVTLVLVAINPSRQFAQANNTKRNSDIVAILNAIHEFSIDNKGILPTGITASVQRISNSGANLCSQVVTRYLAALPTDPSSSASGTPVSSGSCSGVYDTGYMVLQSAADGRITVSAPNAQLSATITVTR